MQRRTFAALGLAAGLAACAGMNTLRADVSTFGDWPAGRAPGTFAFERLPSQQADAARQSLLESAAAAALAQAGFKPAAPNADPDVLVQLGARTTRTDPGPWDDPLWWHGGFGAWRYGPWRGPSWTLGMHYTTPRYEREVAVLLRDRVSGKPLYEARASNDGLGAPDAVMLGAMFRAALTDFPRTGLNPRSVTVPMSTAPAQAK